MPEKTRGVNFDGLDAPWVADIWGLRLEIAAPRAYRWRRMPSTEGAAMELDHNAPPIHPLPWAVWLLVLPIAAIEIALAAGGGGMIGGPQAIGWRLMAVQDVAVSGPVARWMLEQGHLDAANLVRFVAYPFVQTDSTLAVFVVVILAAVAKAVGEVFAGWAVLAVFFVSALAGGVLYCALPGSEVALVGGMPPVYGMIGAFTWMKWQEARATGGDVRKAFRLIGFLLGFQLFLGLIALVSGEPSYLVRIMAAKFGGFLAGFGLAPLVRPGGPGAILAAARRR